MPVPVGEIIAGAASIGSAAFGTAGSRKQRTHQKRMARQQREYGREMADYAYAKDLEQWQRENEYNLPSAQMQRLRDAGINPHMAYAKGTINNVTSGGPRQNVPEIPNYQAIEAYNPAAHAAKAINDFVPMLMNYQDVELKRAQTDATSEQANYTFKKALSEDLKATGYLTDNQMKRLQLAAFRDDYIANRDITQSRREILKEELTSKEQQAIISKINKELKEWERELSKDNLTPQNAYEIKQANEILKDLGVENDTSRGIYNLLIKFGLDAVK